MKVVTKSFSIQTKKGPEFIDLTERIKKIVEETKIKNGIVTIFSKHTTAAIKINENEPLLIRDMENFLNKLAPLKAEYNHNDFQRRTVNMCNDECANGHSHCQHLLLGTSERIPILNGEIILGVWQRIFLVELDRARKREVVIQIIGE